MADFFDGRVLLYFDNTYYFPSRNMLPLDWRKNGYSRDLRVVFRAVTLIKKYLLQKIKNLRMHLKMRFEVIYP